MEESKKVSDRYKNILTNFDCSKCRYKNVCFLQKISLSKYPEQVQEFVIKLPRNTFLYQEQTGLWYTNYLTVQEQLVHYYDIHNCELVENKKPFLTNEGQRENDKQNIRELFKQMLDIAAKTTEETNPEMSIMFDGVGLVLASDYVEAVSKIFSMLKTAIKSDNYFSRGCFGY